MNIAIIVQARMGSTRLPGKVLKPVLGKPLLGYLIERLRKVRLANQIIIATTQEPLDDVIESFCQRLNVACFRGASENVLDRYLEAAKKYSVDIVVRITADCPLIDPSLIDNVIKAYLQNENALDYVSNCATFERTFPRGMDTELVTVDALTRINKFLDLTLDKEHVTSFIHRKPNLFRRLDLCQAVDQSMYRLTVDMEEDFILIKKILERLYPQMGAHFALKDIFDLFDQDATLFFINSAVEQKSDHL